MENPKSKKALPTSLIQAYKQAFDEAEQSSNPEKKIKAYIRVIEFCANTKSCRWNPDIKRNMLLYWAHNNIAKALMEERRYAEAIHYWQKSILLAIDEVQKINVWEQMIEAWGKTAVSLQQRCQEIIKIINPLSEAYAKTAQPLEIKRLAKLKQSLAELIKKSAH